MEEERKSLRIDLPAGEEGLWLACWGLRHSRLLRKLGRLKWPFVSALCHHELEWSQEVVSLRLGLAGEITTIHFTGRVLCTQVVFCSQPVQIHQIQFTGTSMCSSTFDFNFTTASPLAPAWRELQKLLDSQDGAGGLRSVSGCCYE